MGEVFRARDSRLERQVAIKLLPAALSDDAERLRRFEHEARAAAALAHPNVLAVHDVGSHEGAPYLVCELIDGETLRQKIAAGPLPARRAIDVAVQVAHGLAAAHEAGIVHRDLKPENLMVGRDGRVRILDFGLAKLSGPGFPGAGAASTAPTVLGGTEPGVLLGTVGYMSPEQARGEPADGRSDLFALGGILFEMVAGRRAFKGSSPIEILHAILRDEAPELAEPPALGRVIARCLAKDPRDRFQSARDLAFHLESLAGSTSGASGLAPLPAPPPGRLRAGVAAAALAILAAGIAAGLLFPRETSPPPRVRYLTSSGHDAKPSVSPDGRSIAFVSVRDGTSRIWLADLVSRDEAALTAGPDDQLPRFSPDGSAVLFTRLENGRASIFRVGVLGGEPRRIASDADDGDWSPDGKSVVFVRTRPDADGQVVQLVTARVDGSDERVLATTSDAAFLFPRFSPDGRAVAVVRSRRGNIALGDEIVLVDLAGETRTLLAAEPGIVAGAAAWTAAGDLVAVTGALPAVGGTGRLLRVDPRSGRRRVLLEDPDGIAAVDVASSGTVVFESGESGGSLVEVGPGGLRVLAAGHATERQPAVDPRGEWVAYSSNRAGNLDVWALSARTGEVRRLTDHPAEDWDPAWLPDGRLLWSSGRSGAFEIWTAEPDGSAPRPLSRDGVDAENPSASPDGAWVVYSSTNPAGTGIWKIKSDGSEPTLLVASPRAIIPEVSPDGRHVLYLDAWGGGATTTVLRVVELADGAPVPFEIRVPGGTAAGDQSARVFFGRARWLEDGRRIAFIGSDGGRATIFAQDFRPGEDTTTTRRRLVELPADLVPESFAVAPDGRLVVAAYRPTSYLLLAEGLAGVERPRPGAR